MDLQERLGWGSQIIDNLAAHIKKEFPDSKGFSVRNLKCMTSLAETYPQFPIVQVPLAQTPNDCASQPCTDSLAYHISLMAKVKDINERAFYILKTTKN